MICTDFDWSFVVETSTFSGLEWRGLSAKDSIREIGFGFREGRSRGAIFGCVLGGSEKGGDLYVERDQ
jgi:hypothetical protein